MTYDDIAVPNGIYVGVHFSRKTVADLAAYQVANKIPNPNSEHHSTIVYSKKPIAWDVAGAVDETARVVGIDRWHSKGKNCLVLLIDCPWLTERWEESRRRGALWDYPTYKPHITLSYDCGNLDPKSLPFYKGEIRIVEEYVDEIEPKWGS